MEIRANALAGPLHPDLAPALRTLVRPSVRLTRGELANPASSVTRLGGLPLLAPGSVWPRSDAGESLSLIGVWITNEINTWYGGPQLPPDQVLSFFYDGEQRVWGFDQADKQFWRVVAAALNEAVAVGAPEGAETYKCWSLTPQRVLTLPDIWDPAIKELTKNDDAWNAYHRLELDIEQEPPIHRAFGWPEPQQSAAMPMECQLVTNGISMGGPEGYEDPRATALRAGAADWVLLWQIDTDGDAGWMWGDMGTIYYWIRRQDLAVGDFDRIWMILQG